MISRRKTLFALAFFSLLGVLGFLFHKTRLVDLGARNAVVRDLRTLKQLNAEWNVNVLRSRIGIDNNYDPLVAPLYAVQELENDLRTALQIAPGGVPESALSRLKSAFSEKERLVEQFKSQNAVLKNSLRYFPIAAEEFKALLAHTVVVMPNRSKSLGLLDTRVDRLLKDILKFNLLPDADLGKDIAQQIDALDIASGLYPSLLVEPMELMAKHARTILQQRLAEDALVDRIASPATVQSVDDMSGAVDGAFQNALLEKQRFRTYLFVFSGLLIVLLAYAAWTLMKSFKTIAHVNRRLQSANQTLEQRVAERTAELEKQAARLEQLATYDALTGLINRGQLMSRLTRALQRAQRRASVVVVMFFDLDGFKAVNDTYGHASGDTVLKEVATRVQRHLRQTDSLARLGGDEFVILLEQVDGKEGAVKVAEQALNEICGITDIGGKPVAISASIGIGSMVVRTVAGETAEALLSQADQAMYCAKQAGKNCIRFSEQAVWI